MQALLRLLWWLRVTVRNLNKPTHRNLVQGNNPCPVVDLVSNVEDRDDDEIQVGADEGFRVPTNKVSIHCTILPKRFFSFCLKWMNLLMMDKNSIATRQQNNSQHEETSPAHVWLKGRLPRQLITGNALFLHGVVEAQVHDADNGPAHQDG